MASSSAGDCTPSTCPVDNGFLSEPPSQEGAAILLATFSVLIPINLWAGARCKTTTYSLILVTGLLVEVMGYVGRLLLRGDVASKTYYILFLLGTVMGPTFITAAVFTILPHVLAVYGSDVSIAPRPVWLTYLFLFFDVFTIFFQALGGAFVAEGYDSIQIQQGLNVLVAGLAIQIASILIFFGAYFTFLYRIAQNREFLDPRFSDIYLSARFKSTLLCMQIALALILIRTIARLVQLASGLDSALSQSQVYIVVLDGVLVLIATIFLTITPPGPAFGRAWGATSPSGRKARRHLAHLDLVGHGSLRSPSYRLNEHESPYPSPQSGGGGGVNHPYGYGARSSRRYSPSWPGGGVSPAVLQQQQQQQRHRQQHKRQLSANSSEPPAYDRPQSNYTRVPYMPAAAVSLSQQYGQGRVVESQVVAPGTEGTRTGGSGGSGSGGARTRTRSSPRAYEEDMVRHDAIW